MSSVIVSINLSLYGELGFPGGHGTCKEEWYIDRGHIACAPVANVFRISISVNVGTQVIGVWITS